MNTPHIDRISTRSLDLDNDLALLFVWLSDPEVRRWYDEGEHSLENYRLKFSPEPGLHRYIICIDVEPVGYLQAYRLSNEPEYQAQLGLVTDAVAFDLFIGNADYRGKGWGPLVLEHALDTIAFGEFHAEWACINPDPENERAVRAYLKAGFEGDRIVWVDSDEPGDRGYERIMTISRERFYGSRT